MISPDTAREALSTVSMSNWGIDVAMVDVEMAGECASDSPG